MNIPQKQKNNKLEIVIALAIIALGIVFAYQALKFFWNAFSTINPTIGAGIIAATATIIVSVVSILIAKRLENKEAIIKAHRDKKTPVYEKIVQLIFSITLAEILGKPKLTEKELITKVAWITENLIVWGPLCHTSCLIF